MTAQLKVENAVERSLGSSHEIRFWLSTEINGRKVESRGTVAKIEKPTVADARDFARRIGYSVAGAIFNNQWTAENAKEANAALPSLVSDAIAADTALDAAFDSLAK